MIPLTLCSYDRFRKASYANECIGFIIICSADVFEHLTQSLIKTVLSVPAAFVPSEWKFIDIC
jgi:hypothetical protein